MQEWIKVADTIDLAPERAKVVHVLGQNVAIFNVRGELCAIDNTCPHQGGPLGEGT